MAVKEVFVISMPGASPEQMQQIGAALGQSKGMPNVPLFITKATIQPVTVKEIKALRDDLNILLEKIKRNN